MHIGKTTLCVFFGLYARRLVNMNFIVLDVGIPTAWRYGVQPTLCGYTSRCFQDSLTSETSTFMKWFERSETCTSADVPVQNDMNIEKLAEGLLKRVEPASGATFVGGASYFSPSYWSSWVG